MAAINVTESYCLKKMHRMTDTSFYHSLPTHCMSTETEGSLYAYASAKEDCSCYMFTGTVFSKCLSKAIQANRAPMGRLFVETAAKDGYVKFSTEFSTSLLILTSIQYR